MSVSSTDRLTVTCPACGKSGKLPVGVTVYPKTVKCTGCQTRFHPGADLVNLSDEFEVDIAHHPVPPSLPRLRRLDVGSFSRFGKLRRFGSTR